MPKFIWKWMTFVPKLLYRMGLGRVIGQRILLLTTTGRRSGLARATPLRYDFVDGQYLLGSARGLEADWVRNILAHPLVTLKIGRQEFSATGTVHTDRNTIAQFIEQRYENHPMFIRIVFFLQGIRGELNRDVFLRYAENKVMVALEPVEPPS